MPMVPLNLNGVTAVVIAGPEILAPVAGLSGLSRILMRLAAAGIPRAEVWQQTHVDRATIADDLSRAGLAMVLVWKDGLPAMPPPPVLHLSGHAVPGVSLLQRLMREKEAKAITDEGGHTILTWLPDDRTDLQSAPPMSAAASEFIALHHSRQATARILQETGKASDGLVSRHLNRPVSRWLTAQILRFPRLRPWHMTLVNAAITLAMATVLAGGGRLAIAMGCLLYHAASVFDGVDGEMARATFRSSAAGAKLDTAVDMATNLLFLLALGRGLYLTYAPLHAEAALVGGVLFLAGVIVLTVLIRLGPGGGSFDTLANAYFHRFRASSIATALGRGFNVVMKRDFFALFFALLGLAGLAWLIPWLFAALALLWVGLILALAPTLLSAEARNLRPDHIKALDR